MLTLAGYAIIVEDHYDRPMDIEWAKDGIDGKLYLVQARPETVASQKAGYLLEEYELKGTGPILATGRSVGGKIATGPARLISGAAQLREFKAGEVLVSDTTTPDWEAGAAVTVTGRV